MNADTLSDLEYKSIGVTPYIELAADLDGDGYWDYPLKEGTDYKVSYSGNKKVGQAAYKITYLGNFKGNQTNKGGVFFIKQAQFDEEKTFVSVTEQFVFNPKNPKAGDYFAKPCKSLTVLHVGV